MFKKKRNQSLIAFNNGVGKSLKISERVFIVLNDSKSRHLSRHSRSCKAIENTLKKIKMELNDDNLTFANVKINISLE
jgi:hypothetical protein